MPESAARVVTATPRASGSASRALLLALAPAALVAALYAPAVRLELVSDDLNWAQQARRAVAQPGLLLADLDTFYRPASTWSLVVDRALWGSWAGGYHLSNLALHAIAGCLLLAAGRRLGLGWLASLAVAVLWVSSPLTSEPALAVAIRFQDLLLIAWLALGVLWPRPGARWTRLRATAAVAATLLAYASKETAVVTPALILALELGRRASLRQAIRRVAPVAALSAVYVAAYFLVFPSTKGYFEPADAAAKLPHMLGTFLHLHAPDPHPRSASGLDLVALVLTLAAAAWSVAGRRRVGLLGLGLLFAAYAPTAAVPYLPSRYMTIPYAGFLLLAAGVAAGVCASPLAGRARRMTAVALLVTALLVAVADGVGLGAELRDARRLSDAHRTLFEEARRIAPQLPRDRPIAFLRLERTEPLHELAASPAGLRKVYFVRGPDPYGLADVAALFDWVGAPSRRLSIERLDDRERLPLLLHRDGGFAWDTTPGPASDAALERARKAGAVRVFEVLGARATRP